MEEVFVVFDSHPPDIVSLLHFDKLGLTQDRFCNSVAAAT